jgi:two-component system sensor histidine kinase UhpB
MSADTLTSASPDSPGGLLGGAPACGQSGDTPNPYRNAACVLLVAVAYYAGTRVGFALTRGDTPISFFWPPNAIVLAALLLAPVSLWWKIVLGLIPVHFLAQLPAGVPFTTALGWFAGNVSEAVIGAALLQGSARRGTLFHSLDGVTRFLLCGFILAPMITSFLDAAIVVETNWGRNYWLLWTTRGLSNMLAELTIVPVIVVVATAGRSWVKRASGRTWIEAILLAAAVAIVSVSILELEHPTSTDVPALIYVPLPLLLWASLRFGPAGLSASLLTTSVVAIHAVMHGRGPFIGASVAASVLSMQLFLCMMGVPMLILAAVAAERRRDAQAIRELTRRLIDAQERERQHIARELHDGVAQNLALAELELDRIVDQTPGHAGGGLLIKVRDQLTMVSQSLWEISHGLYPSNLQYLGLVLGLTRLCSDLGDETQINIQCHVEGIPDHLPPDVSLCLFRVTQEALQNVAKHSQARNASMRLFATADRIRLQIGDDGAGFQRPVTMNGLGFASIRERLNAINGDIEVHSAPGRGTRLEAWVPYRLPTAPREPGPGSSGLMATARNRVRARLGDRRSER